MRAGRVLCKLWLILIPCLALFIYVSLYWCTWAYSEIKSGSSSRYSCFNTAVQNGTFTFTRSNPNDLKVNTETVTSSDRDLELGQELTSETKAKVETETNAEQMEVQALAQPEPESAQIFSSHAHAHAADHDRDLSKVSQTESEFDLLINTRTLTLLAAQKLNQLVQQLSNNSAMCAKWWANPLETRRNQIISFNADFEDHLLEFEAESKWEKVKFQVKVRVRVNVWPHAVEFANFTRTKSDSESDAFRRLLSGRFNCLNETRTRFDDATQNLATICSCAEPEPDNSGHADLPTWPQKASFMVGDYLNFGDSASLFSLVPRKRSHCAPLKLLIMVSSAPTHFEERQTIRETYGSKVNLDGKSVELVFLYGRVDNDALQELVEFEAKTYSDIIQATFMDSYHNLTLSHLSMYAYVHFSCSGTWSQSDSDKAFNASEFRPPKHVLKADDDFFLNVDLALRIAEANSDAELIGCSYCGTEPIHDLAYLTKYYTPRYMYLGLTYPGYLSGVAYLVRGDTLPSLLQASLSTPLIHMDDVYVTGLLPRALGIHPRNCALIGYGRYETPCGLKRMACSYVLGSKDMRATWDVWMESGDAGADADGTGNSSSNCTDVTNVELKVSELTPEFKSACRYT